MVQTNILIIGGYGNFGKRICESLIKLNDIKLIVAGRNQGEANDLANKLNRQRENAAAALVVDGKQSDLSQQLASSGAELLVNASGPFQNQDYTIAQVCIDAGVHYLDLADSREFVVGIDSLDEKAKAAGVSIVSGVSTVPALSSAVVDKYQCEFETLESYYAGITPGYQAERGDATTAGILSYLGQPIRVYDNGDWVKVTALQGLHRYNYNNELGKRLLGYVDVPDLALFPKRYAGIRSVKFYSGLEIGFMHMMLWAMTWLSRWRIVKNWGEYAKPLIAISHCFDKLGTPDGGMFIELSGKDKQGRVKKVTWHLIARNGHGPYVPTIPVVVLVKKLIAGEKFLKGAYPCMGLFTLDEFFEVAENWDIEQSVYIQ